LGFGVEGARFRVENFATSFPELLGFKELQALRVWGFRRYG